MYQPVNMDLFQDEDILQSGVSLDIQGSQHTGSETLLTNVPSVHNSSSTTRSTLEGLHNHWMSIQQQHVYMSVIFFAIGFSAILALAIAIFGWLPLDIATYIFVWPSLLIWCMLGILYPDYGKLALRGFIVGIFACMFYDSMRFTAIALGLWGDFIPNIGMWFLHTNKPNWVVGYIWRYVGDGGLMSSAFVVGYRLLKPKLNVCIASLAFGLAIWLGLIGTILLASHGTEMLFKLTPITFSLSLLGHIIYGLSIGFLYPIFIRQKAFSQLFRLIITWYNGNTTSEKENMMHLQAKNQTLQEQLQAANQTLQEQLQTANQTLQEQLQAASIRIEELRMQTSSSVFLGEMVVAKADTA